MRIAYSAPTHLKVSFWELLDNRIQSATLDLLLLLLWSCDKHYIGQQYGKIKITITMEIFK